MMRTSHFDYRFLLIALTVNGSAVFFINLREGGTSGAFSSGIVQLCVSGLLAGYTIPYTIRHSLVERAVVAYRRGSLYMASFVATIGGVAHALAATPSLWGTVAWNFFLNASVGASIVFLKRNEDRLWPVFKHVAQRLRLN